jgi:TonB family protein
MLPLAVAQIVAPATSPTPVVCARPNVPAQTIRHAEPVLPVAAEALGLQGTVAVVVSLDATGSVTAARVQSSPSGILNEAALAAARASSFRPEIRDCRPVAGDYTYTVDVESRVTALPSPPGRRIVSVAGKGMVLRAPDAASVQVRLVAKDESAARAAAKNEAQFQALAVKLSALGVDPAKARTLFSTPRSPIVLESDASLPHYGFASSRDVMVEVGAPADAMKVAAALTVPGGFEVVGIRYALSASGTAYEDALRAAIADAETRARVVASAYHMHVGAARHVQLPPKDDGATAPLTVFVRYAVFANAGTAGAPAGAIPRIPVDARATIVFELEP